MPASSTPMLFIGLGTSGLRMLEEAQRFFYSATGCSCPDHVRFLFVETDADQKAAHILGAPIGRRAMESFPTPIATAEVSVEQLRRKVRVRVIQVDAPPKEAWTILEVREGQPTAVPDLQLPDGLYNGMAHVISRYDRKIVPAAYEPLRGWFKELNAREGFVSLRLREDLGGIVEIYVPRSMPQSYTRRVEILFNNIELTTGENGNVRWLPDPGKMAFAGAGAGGMRSFGRVALWSISREGGGLYLHGLRDKIRALYIDLRTKFPPGGGMNEPAVYIAGTYTGGTNSGMFIDVAYLCRDVIDPTHQLNPPVMGLFLLPPVDSADVKSVSNAYACLEDLKHFTRPDSQFLARWPLDVAVDPFPQGKTPFSLATLMSLSWVPDGDVQSLYRMAGLFLFVMGSGFMSYRKARVIDIFDGGNNVWKFSAVGMTCLFYPRGEVRACAAGQYARERLIQMWNEKDQARGLRAAGAIDRVFADRRKKYRQAVDSCIKEAFEHLGNAGPDGRSAMTFVRGFLAEVARRDRSFDHETLLNILGSDGPLFMAAQASARTAAAIVRSRIGALVLSEIEDTECLLYANKVIDEVCGYLEETLEFWGKQKIEPWNNALERATDEDGAEGLIAMLQSGEDWFLNGVFAPQETNILRLSRIGEVLQKMEMSVLAPEFRKLINYLRADDAGSYGGRDTGPDPADVPSKADIAYLRAALADADKSILGFQKQVREGVRPNDLIKYYFRTGSFDGKSGDVGAAIQDFSKKPSAQPADAKSLSAFLLVDTDAARERDGGGVPWSGIWKELWLRSHSGGEITTWLLERLSSQFERAGVPDPGFDKGITAHPELGIAAGTAKMNMSLQLGVATDFLTNAKTHPKVIVTSSKASQEEVHRRLDSEFNQKDFMANEAACTFVGDMVVFFDERPVQKLDDLARLNLWQPKYDERRANDPSLDCYIQT